MIELVLENKKWVLSGFIDSMFLGVEMSETLEEVDFKTIEKMLLIFLCDILHSNALNCVRGRAAKQIILTYKNIDTDVEFPLSRMFYDKYVDAA